jgi:hypothetical protein
MCVCVCLWFFYNKSWDYVVIWIHFLVIQISIGFYNEIYVHLSCEFFVVLDYDEMNCNFVFKVFYNVLWSANFSICNNHKFDVGMNGNVKFVGA